MREIKLISADPYSFDYVEGIIPTFTKEDYEARFALLVDKIRDIWRLPDIQGLPYRYYWI